MFKTTEMLPCDCQIKHKAGQPIGKLIRMSTLMNPPYLMHLPRNEMKTTREHFLLKIHSNGAKTYIKARASQFYFIVLNLSENKQVQVFASGGRSR